MGTSKKQIHKIDQLFTETFGSGNHVYAAGEHDATHNAYIKHDGEFTRYATNSEALSAAVDMLMEATD